MKNGDLEIIGNQNGQAALFIVMIIMSLLLFVSLFLTDITVKQTKIARKTFDSIQSYYLADMGAERVLWGLRATGGDLDVADFPAAGDPVHSQTINNLTGPLKPDGSYEATRIAPTGVLHIKISGEYQNTLRSIELSWN